MSDEKQLSAVDLLLRELDSHRTELRGLRTAMESGQNATRADIQKMVAALHAQQLHHENLKGEVRMIAAKIGAMISAVTTGALMALQHFIGR